MKSRILLSLAVLGLVCFAGSLAMAKEGGQGGEKAAKAAKATKGVLSAKAADAAADVVAVLTAKIKGEEKKLNVITKDAALIEKIKPLVEKGATVSVTGALTADGTGIEATDVAEAVAKEKKEKKQEEAKE